MKAIQNGAGFFFIIAVAILSAISIFGIWDIFEKDVITKSFETLGLLALVAVIIMIAGRFIGGGHAANVPTMPSPAFMYIRRATLGVLIISVSLLALLGVMTIWEVIKDKDVLHKSFSSLILLAFSAFIIVVTCLEREGKLQGNANNKGVSSGVIIGFIILVILLISWFFRGF